MAEKLKITNFAGISQLELDINHITVLIGPQGSGKSISVKLLYFFKTFFAEIIKSVMDEESKRDLDKRQKDKFINFFPKDSWPQGNFTIVYSYGSENISSL
jgi:AAA15 family ATPase/GTPase